ncbi:hypothetical protein [Salsipaludibacter albus]|uniref:hypothetical protein n=1 Tax=Salsipaludibacter albus TaxID=2849650 RepID=UPI001EE484CF|nr:hypothetical protein [Salsipaludibacter albus]
MALHALTGLGLVVLAWRLLAGLESAWRVLGVVVVGSAWGALGLLGLVLVLASRDAVKGARVTRDVRSGVARVEREVGRLHADVREGQQQAETVWASQAAAHDDLAGQLASSRAELGRVEEHLDRTETAVEQVGLDTSRGVSAAVLRLDEIVDRLRHGTDTADKA